MTSQININKIPKLSDTYLLCDYIELLCLFNRDQEISKADVIDRIKEILDVDKSSTFGSDSSDEDDEELLEEKSKKNDRLEIILSDCFSNLRYRIGSFDSFYPFYFPDSSDLIRLQPILDDKHKFYIFMLFASNLKYFGKYKQNITSSFEKISKKALEKCLPLNAEVHIFGTSDSKTGRYTGNKRQKLRILATDLKTMVIMNEEEFSKHDAADDGLDVVAWIPMGDAAEGTVILFGQCACTEDWISKQHSSSYDVWSVRIKLHTYPSNFIFIPFCFRNSTGGWWKTKDIHKSVLIDRKRFVHLLSNDYAFIKEYPVYKDIEKIISYRESIV